MGLSWVRPGVCQSYDGIELQGTFYVPFPEKFLLVVGAHSQTRCLPSAHCWSSIQTGVYGSLLLSPEQELLWSDVDFCEGCLHTAMLVVLLWVDSCHSWVRGCKSIGECTGAALVRFVLSAVEGDPVLLWVSVESGVEWVGPGVGCAVSKK